MKQYRVRINGRDYDVAISQVSGKTAEVSVNGTPYEVEIEETTAAAQKEAGIAAGSKPAASAPQHAFSHEMHRHPHHPGANDPDARDVVSPLPGVILGIYVGIGEKVRKGQKVAVLEAMKMENEIEADADGTISAIHVQKNDSVLEGARIVTIIK